MGFLEFRRLAPSGKIIVGLCVGAAQVVGISGNCILDLCTQIHPSFESCWVVLWWPCPL